MSNVLGLTKNNDRYRNVPDKLKWAIPLHEAATSGESKERIRQLKEKVARELEVEDRQRRKQALTSLPKP